MVSSSLGLSSASELKLGASLIWSDPYGVWMVPFEESIWRFTAGIMWFLPKIQPVLAAMNSSSSVASSTQTPSTSPILLPAESSTAYPYRSVVEVVVFMGASICWFFGALHRAPTEYTHQEPCPAVAAPACRWGGCCN